MASDELDSLSIDYSEWQPLALTLVEYPKGKIVNKSQI